MNMETKRSEYVENKPVVYYDDMISPTYIRLISERLNLDHIVYTEANEQPMRYSDIRRLAETELFNKILVCACKASRSCNSLYLRHPKGSVPIGEEVCYLNDDWINVSDVVLVDSKSDTNIAERHNPHGNDTFDKRPRGQGTGDYPGAEG